MANPVCEAWGDFLNQFRWDWYVTLTFEDEVKTFTARNRCKAWLGQITKAAGRPISWFRGDQYGRLGRFHFHMLIGNVAHVHRFTSMKRWYVRNGISRIFPFDPTLGAAYYVTDYIANQFADWDLSDNLEAFRIQQPILPLDGQVGSPSNEKDIRDALVADFMQRVDPQASQHVDQASKLKQRSHGASPSQLSLKDFKEPDLREIDLDPIRASFHLQTVRRR